MSGTLYIQASVEENLDEQEIDQLKQEANRAVEELRNFDSLRVLYQEKKGVTTFGFSVKTNLDELAGRPGNGRYLGMMILDDDGELISEKFILNPAIKVEEGRAGLAFSVLKQNGVDQILLREQPNSDEEGTLGELNLNWRLTPTPELEALRESTDDLLNSLKTG